MANKIFQTANLGPAIVLAVTPHMAAVLLMSTAQTAFNSGLTAYRWLLPDSQRVILDYELNTNPPKWLKVSFLENCIDMSGRSSPNAPGPDPAPAPCHVAGLGCSNRRGLTIGAVWPGEPV